MTQTALQSINDKIALNDGRFIPCVGFGTWEIRDEAQGDKIIDLAIEAGYRHMDTASLYHSEKSIGLAMERSCLERQDFFLTTKIWIDDMEPQAARRSLLRSLDNLKTSYVDLLLIHWPRRNYTDLDWPMRIAALWEEMLRMQDEGLTLSIGVANFLPHHLQALHTKRPAVDQIEWHVGYEQSEVVDYCRARGILVEAWAPLGRGSLLTDPNLMELSEVQGVSTAQLCLRYAVEQGVVPLPKSSNLQRMQDNADIFGFVLKDEVKEALKNWPLSAYSGEHPDKAIPMMEPDL